MSYTPVADGASASISLPKSWIIRTKGSGLATMGPGPMNGQTRGLEAGAVVGPFDYVATVYLSGRAGLIYEAADPADVGALTAAQAAAAANVLPKSVPALISPAEFRGDSFIAGNGLTDPTQWVSAQTAALLGVSASTYGNSGAGVVSFFSQILGGGQPLANVANRLNFQLCGVNEMREGNTSGRLDAYGGVLACLLALQASNLSAWRQYYNGDSATVFGAPAASFVRSGFSTLAGLGLNGYWRGVSSTTNGETITATVQGEAVYIIYDRLKTLTGGTFSVSVDGTVVIPSVSCDGTGLAVCSTDASTADNTNVGHPTLLRVSTGPGRHTVVVTVTSSTSASNKVQIEGIAGSDDMIGPTCVVGATSRLNAAGYSGSPAAYASVALGDAAVSAYNKAARGIVDMLAADGLRVHWAPNIGYDPVLFTGQVQADNLHPSASGAAAIAAGFAAALDIRTVRQPRAYRQATFAPTVGASPYTFTNSGRSDATAIVSGGTLSAVDFSRNGTTFINVSGIGPAQVQLSPGDSIKLTYTVAPTLTVVPR
jgi:hypothetical protein